MAQTNTEQQNVENIGLKKRSIKGHFKKQLKANEEFLNNLADAGRLQQITLGTILVATAVASPITILIAATGGSLNLALQTGKAGLNLGEAAIESVRGRNDKAHKSINKAQKNIGKGVKPITAAFTMPYSIYNNIKKTNNANGQNTQTQTTETHNKLVHKYTIEKLSDVDSTIEALKKSISSNSAEDGKAEQTNAKTEDSPEKLPNKASTEINNPEIPQKNQETLKKLSREHITNSLNNLTNFRANQSDDEKKEDEKEVQEELERLLKATAYPEESTEETKSISESEKSFISRENKFLSESSTDSSTKSPVTLSTDETEHLEESTVETKSISESEKSFISRENKSLSESSTEKAVEDTLPSSTKSPVTPSPDKQNNEENQYAYTKTDLNFTNDFLAKQEKKSRTIERFKQKLEQPTHQQENTIATAPKEASQNTTATTSTSNDHESNQQGQVQPFQNDFDVQLNLKPDALPRKPVTKREREGNRETGKGHLNTLLTKQTSKISLLSL